MNFTPDELETCLKVLQHVSDDPAVMDGHDRSKALVAKVQNRGRKSVKRRLRANDRQADRAQAEQTGVVVGSLALPAQLPAEVPAPRVYRRPKDCYVCKTPFTEVHAFYHQL